MFRGLTVHHPRYFLLPKISMSAHGMLLYSAMLPVVRRLHAREKFDFIDSHFLYPDGFAAVKLGRKLQIPVSVTARGTDANSYPSYGLIRPMLRWTLERADVRIAVAAALRDKMREFSSPGLPIRVIPNGVDTDRFWRTDMAEARRQLGLPSDQSLIVAVGSLTEVKRHWLLIRAFQKIASKKPQICLYIFGEGANRSGLEKLAREVQLQDRIHLPGKIANETLRLWYSAANVSCLTSVQEGWPNAATESLACGTPVVATRVGGIPEILCNEALGVLAEGTIESIASALQEGLSRKWDREEISRRTRMRSWDAVAGEIEETFAEVLSRRGKILGMRL